MPPTLSFLSGDVRFSFVCFFFSRARLYGLLHCVVIKLLLDCTESNHMDSLRSTIYNWFWLFCSSFSQNNPKQSCQRSEWKKKWKKYKTPTTLKTLKITCNHVNHVQSRKLRAIMLSCACFLTSCVEGFQFMSLAFKAQLQPERGKDVFTCSLIFSTVVVTCFYLSINFLHCRCNLFVPYMVDRIGSRTSCFVGYCLSRDVLFNRWCLSIYYSPVCYVLFNRLCLSIYYSPVY